MFTSDHKTGKPKLAQIRLALDAIALSFFGC